MCPVQPRTQRHQRLASTHQDSVVDKMKIYNARIDRYQEMDNKELKAFEIVVKINQSIESFEDLCNLYGRQIYTGQRAKLNPIQPNSSYFGVGYHSFLDCLTSAPHALGVHIISTHGKLFKGLSEDDYLTYLMIIKDCAKYTIERQSSHFTFSLDAYLEDVFEKKNAE
jgi:hypothetical protein